MISHVLTIVAFALLALAFLGIAVASHVPGWPVPTLGRLLAAGMRQRSTRIGILLVWWWLGWHFLSH